MSIRPDDWPRARAVFEHALTLPESERRRYLADACGGREELRQHVERLLESHRKADAFLETPLAPMLDETIAVRSLEGQRIGPYLLSVRVGSGGMGEVYKARDPRLDRTVAIKVLPSHVANDQQARDRFDREGRAIAGLNHPHICVLHDVGEATVASPNSGAPGAQPPLTVQYLVMELLEGETLAARLARGPLPLDEGVTMMVQILRALAHAHGKGILHRDLKPHNIFVLDGSSVKVLDFGLAEFFGPDPSVPPATTGAGGRRPAGSPAYMAPEVWDGSHPTISTDLWAAAVTFFEMLTGRLPFERAEGFSRGVGRSPSARAFNPSLPEQVEQVLARALHRSPSSRFQTADEFVASIADLIAR